MKIQKACLYILNNLDLLPFLCSSFKRKSSSCCVIAIPTHSKFGLATTANVFHVEWCWAWEGRGLSAQGTGPSKHITSTDDCSSCRLGFLSENHRVSPKYKKFPYEESADRSRGNDCISTTTFKNESTASLTHLTFTYSIVRALMNYTLLKSQKLFRGGSWVFWCQTVGYLRLSSCAAGLQMVLKSQ